MKLHTKKFIDDYRDWDIRFRKKQSARRLKPFLKRRLGKARRAEARAFLQAEVDTK